MSFLFNPEVFWWVTAVMAAMAVVVFLALQKFEAAYGMTSAPGWGPTLPNKTGWILMELPAFAVMALIWATSPRAPQAAPCVMASLFQLHYFQRTFIFPLLMRGSSRMPWAITLMGMVFNTVNAYMIGAWLFHIAPSDAYPPSWLLSPCFLVGTAVFLAGMAVNWHSDHVIRCLRRPGDTAHHIPRKGLYRYVTGANYFGELTEWIGFAVLTWSVPGAVFALWTFANLAPRAKASHKRYVARFGREYTSLRRRYIIPFIY